MGSPTTPRRRTSRHSKRFRWRGWMNIGTVNGSRLPGDDLVRRENLLEQRVPREFFGYALNAHAGRQRREAGSVQERDADPVADTDRALDRCPREPGVAALVEMEDRGHQNTMKLRARRIKSAIWSRLTGTTGC